MLVTVEPVGWVSQILAHEKKSKNDETVKIKETVHVWYQGRFPMGGSPGLELEVRIKTLQVQWTDRKDILG